MRKSHIKKVDQDGNIEIPEEFLKQLEIESEDDLEIIIDGDSIILIKK